MEPSRKLARFLFYPEADRHQPLLTQIARMAQTLTHLLTDPRPGPEAIFGHPVVIVGMGPAGVRVTQEIINRDSLCPIVIYEREAWAPYNRVRLSSLITGEAGIGDIANELRISEEGPRVIQRRRCKVISIDRSAMTLTDELGRVQPYSHLILATGSSPHVPHIPGIGLCGVFTFRNLSDAQQLMARTARSHATVVLGGGLLGLEAARGMQRGNTRVTVIEHMPRLMPRQLDEEASRLLGEHLNELGMEVVLGTGVAEVLGRERVKGARLHDSREIACDTLVVAAGIRPNLELARQSRLAVHKGILVDDRLVTSDPNISAIGECAEHRHKIYGLVGPGLDQAAVVAHNVAGGRATYTGSETATRLKVIGKNVFSIGCAGDEEELNNDITASVYRGTGGIYRKVVLRRGRLMGAIGLGEWAELGRIEQAVQSQCRVWPWQLIAFRRSGNIWGEADSHSVAAWPAATRVCNCTGVTRGQLGEAIDAGCRDAAALARRTGASSVCGSCRPLLVELCGMNRLEPEQGWRVLAWLSGIAAALSLAVFLSPSVGYNGSVEAPLRWDLLWRDGLAKQISGFTLLGLSALVLLFSMRKRLRWFKLGTFRGWRLLHVVLSLMALTVLVLHTGLRLGHNLNAWLMLAFSALLITGAVGGLSIALQHRWTPASARRLRKAALWGHVLTFWPLPALLGLHVLKTYWF